MGMRRGLAIALAAVFAAMPMQAAMAEGSPLVSKLSAHVKGEKENAWVVIGENEAVDPGDVIEYRISHTITSEQALRGLVIRGPIPAGARYVDGSARTAADAALEVLISGEGWQAYPGQKTVVAEDGSKQRVDAAPEDYTSLRWRLSSDLDAGVEVTQAYRVQILN